MKSPSLNRNRFSIKFVLTLIVFGQAVFGAGQQDDIRCQQMLRDLKVGGDVIANSTGGHINLTKYLERVSNDPLLPVPVKRVLHEALVRQKTDIKELTDEVRKTMALSQSSRGHYIFSATVITMEGGKIGEISKDNFYLFAENPFVDPNDKSPRSSKVVIEDSYVHATPEECLVHELAHIRFMAFLDRNFQEIAAKDILPSWAILNDQGKYALRADFYRYLTEKYAYEIHFQFVKNAAKSGITPVQLIHPVFGDIRTETDESVRKRIVAHLQKDYQEARTAEFRPFDNLSIAAIFRGRYPKEIPAPPVEPEQNTLRAPVTDKAKDQTQKSNAFD